MTEHSYGWVICAIALNIHLKRKKKRKKKEINIYKYIYHHRNIEESRHPTQFTHFSYRPHCTKTWCFIFLDWYMFFYLVSNSNMA